MQELAPFHTAIRRCTRVAGWPSVDAYYAGSSSARRIPEVKIPLLCIQALDDPIAPKEVWLPCGRCFACCSAHWRHVVAPTAHAVCDPDAVAAHTMLACPLPQAIPYAACEANPNCVLATTPCGGHLGWVSGPGAPFDHPWTGEGAAENALGRQICGSKG